MQLGDVLVVKGDAAAVDVLTPWMDRLADNARFTVEVSNLIENPYFEVQVLRKDREDVSRDGTLLSVTWDSTGVGNTTFLTGTASGLKEMIRFRVVLTGSGGAEPVEAVLYRFLPVTWFNTSG